MKIKESRHKISVDVYDSIIYLVLTENILYSKKKLSKKLKIDYNSEDDADGWFIYTDVGTYYIILNINPSIFHTVHESTHAAVKILEDHGINFVEDNDESLAYLNGYITDKIMQKVLHRRKNEGKDDTNKS